MWLKGTVGGSDSILDFVEKIVLLQIKSHLEIFIAKVELK